MSERNMEYRRMGASGLRLSKLSLGGWTTFGASIADEALVREILTAARDAGVNFFDIADAYGRGEAERVMGAVLADFPRHELVISSKAFWPMSEDPNDRGLSRKHLFESVEKSLHRLGTDYLDLFFCHRFDADTPLDETVMALDDLVRQGKVLYWGTSEWTGAQLREVHAVADRRNAHAPRVEQPQYSLLARRKVEGDVLAAARDTGMGIVVWSPLASGLLTGKYDAGLPEGSRLARIEWLRSRLAREEHLDRIRQMKALADELGCTRTQLALAWAAAREGVTSVIMGATSVAQLEENLGALDVHLDASLLSRLDALFPPDGMLDG